MTAARYPVATLVAALPKEHRGTPARFLRVSGSHWKRYEANGLTAAQADRLAVRAGMHPSLVWPNWIDDTTHLFTKLRNQLAGTRWAA